MARIIEPEEVNIDRYSSIEGKDLIFPASYFRDETVNMFYGEQADAGTLLPWGKTHSLIKIRPGDTSIWSGINGHGKSILLNMVSIGFCCQSDKVCIASMEMKPKQTLMRMVRQWVGGECPAIPLIDDFYRWTDEKLWLYNKLGTVKPKEILAVTNYCIRELGIRHMIIDSFMKCGIGVDDLNGQKDFIDKLCTLGKDTDTNIHLVAHSRKRDTEGRVMDKFDIKGAGEVSDMPDNIFSLWRNKAKESKLAMPEIPDDEKEDLDKKPDAMLICDKQRNGDWEGRIGLWFNKKSMQYLTKQSTRSLSNDDWLERQW